jgi:hypothetical protein
MKTFTIIRAMCMRAFRTPYSRQAAFKLRGNSANATLALDTIPKVLRLCFPGVEVIRKKQDGYFYWPHNKAELWISGLDDAARVDKILGAEYSGLFFNECSQIPWDSVVVARTRLAQQVKTDDITRPDGSVIIGGMLKNRVYYDLNPGSAAHYSAALFLRGEDPITKLPLPDPENYVHAFMSPRDNPYVSEDFIRELESLPERARRRFLDGVYTADIDGALWTPESLAAAHCDFADMPDLERIVVGVDPSGHDGAEGTRADTIGICVAGRGIDGNGYVLEDLTCSLAPEAWALRVVKAYRTHRADCIVAEKNFGGDLVRAVIQAADPSVPVKLVNASRSKHVRAEPVAVFFEEGRTLRGQNRVFFAGDNFRSLEAELEMFTTTGFVGKNSPGAADAFVWAIHELLLAEIKNKFCFG